MKFVKGMDLSTLLELERCGAKYYDNGEERDLLAIMKSYDVDTIRIRLWNDPWSETGESYGAGENDLKTSLEIAKRVTAAGFGVLLNFHYSDFWADPGKQIKPKAWADYGVKELEQAVSEGQYERAAVLRDRLQTLIRQQMSVTQSLRGRALDREDVAQTVAERTGIPAGKLTAPECGKLLGLREELRSRIVGQEQAVEEVSKAVLRGRAGLGERTRPAASLLFMGPTGVGKTELCKALADCVYGSRDALVRIDMTEYMEPNSVTRLIGAPPGYIGYDEGGTLTEKVRRRPYSVVLLDELEKAHRDVTGLLLQILEDGILTDSLGRTVDFKNTMIVMTSNLGSGESVKNGVGFTPGSAQDRTKRILRQAFPAELLGRIDCITTFRPLSQDDLAEIARRQLRQMVQRAALRGLELEISEEVCPYLAALCSQDDSGARSVRHRIQDMVETALSERLLQKDAPRRLTVAADENGISVLETMRAGG